MIKIVFCLHRLPSLTRDAFQTYWRETHAPLVRRHAPVLGIRRYVQAHTISHPIFEPVAASRSVQVPEYDGVAELWFDSEEALGATLSSPEGQAAGAELLEDEKRFIDHARSPIFFIRENVVVSG